jgi:nucleoside-diphosphate-sugar epimerase
VLTCFAEKNPLPPIPSPPFSSAFQGYCASKISSHHAIMDFQAKNKPSFDVTTIHPSFVIGRSELITDPALITKGTNAAAMRQVLGINYPIPTPSSSVHLFDVAMLHVRALDPKIPGGQKFFASSEGPKGCTWADSIDIVKKHFPDEVAKGVFPLGGSIITKPILVDSSYTEKTFGFKFRSYEEQVTSVAGHYAELVAKNGGNNVDHSLASWTSWSKK